MSGEIADLARRLAEQAEAVCRYYLPAGRREGRQWRVGDIHNALGRSLFVRLVGPTRGKDAAGRWMDAATGEHGDLIDLIKASRRFSTFRAALGEAREFLNLSTATTRSAARKSGDPHGIYDPMTTIRRLLRESRPIGDTLAQRYLRQRGIDDAADLDALRFHPSCAYRDATDGRFSLWPAMLALVTSLDGALTGMQRTYLSPTGDGKAALAAPRRSLGALRRHGVRFGAIKTVGAIGEGVETMLSLKSMLPTMPMVAALSAGNLAAIQLPASLRRLYIVVDLDPAGVNASKTLSERARGAGVRAVSLMPVNNDFNADLTEIGSDALHRHVRAQLLREDLDRLALNDVGAQRDHGDG